jgi:hypothetical protein
VWQEAVRKDKVTLYGGWEEIVLTISAMMEDGVGGGEMGDWN